MKTLATLLLAVTTSMAMAQRTSSISRSINDDGKTLSIRVNGVVDGNPIEYDRTFDVSSLNKDERNALREHILDSLHVSTPKPPRAPDSRRAAMVPRTPIAPSAPLVPAAPLLRSPRDSDASESIVITSGDDRSVSMTGHNNQVIVVGGKQPYTKEVSYNSESGKLFLRYRFKKDEDDFTYERTIDAPNKSQQERQRIIDAIEETIGVPKASR